MYAELTIFAFCSLVYGGCTAVANHYNVGQCHVTDKLGCNKSMQFSLVPAV